MTDFLKLKQNIIYLHNDINKFSHVYKFSNNDQIFKEILISNHKDNLKII